MMKWCSVTFAVVMFADCVAVLAAADAAALLADVLVVSVVAAAVLAAVTVGTFAATCPYVLVSIS